MLIFTCVIYVHVYIYTCFSFYCTVSNVILFISSSLIKVGSATGDTSLLDSLIMVAKSLISPCFVPWNVRMGLSGTAGNLFRMRQARLVGLSGSKVWTDFQDELRFLFKMDCFPPHGPKHLVSTYYLSIWISHENKRASLCLKVEILLENVEKNLH